MMVKKYWCCECNNRFKFSDMFYPEIVGRCKFCMLESKFRANAAQNIINHYGLRAGEYTDDILEIEILRCKLRWVEAGKQIKYITYKKETMTTNVTNSDEMRQALNENLHSILTGKRKLIVAKEVNNTLGKILSDVKMELMQNAITGNREQIGWFNPQKQLQ